MDLCWCRYGKFGDHKHQLMLELGIKGDLLYFLKADTLSKTIIATLRNASAVLDGMNLDERVAWIKTNCPETANHIRSFKPTNVSIIKKYPIK